MIYYAVVYLEDLNQRNYLLILGCLKDQYLDHYSFLYIYKNDLPHVSNVFKIVMYADDTTLSCNIDNNVTEDVINANFLRYTSSWEQIN